LLKLGEGLGELFAHFADGHGSPDAGHHVLALGIGQELTEQLLLAGGGVAGEGHAGAAVVAHVAEGHGLDVDGGAPGVGDVVVPAVHVGAGVVPGAEHGLDGAHQLLLGVGGEVCADLGLVLGLELAGQLLQVVGSQ
ncbi:HTH-like domain-containing protein, partial [Dysosmobacter welbionis]